MPAKQMMAPRSIWQHSSHAASSLHPSNARGSTRDGHACLLAFLLTMQLLQDPSFIKGRGRKA